MDIKALRLTINALRRAELDYLAPRIHKRIRDSARVYLFGITESPLPSVCRVLGINTSAARLILLKWRAQGKVGDPLFGYLADPSNLLRMERGLPLARPDFQGVYAGNGNHSGGQEGSERRPTAGGRASRKS